MTEKNLTITVNTLELVNLVLSVLTCAPTSFYKGYCTLTLTREGGIIGERSGPGLFLCVCVCVRQLR